MRLMDPTIHQDVQVPKMVILNLKYGYFGGGETSLT